MEYILLLIIFLRNTRDEGINYYYDGRYLDFDKNIINIIFFIHYRVLYCLMD